MATVVLKIDPRFCGPMSVGTVTHVKLIRMHLDIGLAAAADFVNRATFAGESVRIDVPKLETARALASALSAIEGPAVTEAHVLPEG